MESSQCSPYGAEIRIGEDDAPFNDSTTGNSRFPSHSPTPEAISSALCILPNQSIRPSSAPTFSVDTVGVSIGTFMSNLGSREIGWILKIYAFNWRAIKSSEEGVYTQSELGGHVLLPRIRGSTVMAEHRRNRQVNTSSLPYSYIDLINLRTTIWTQPPQYRKSWTKFRWKKNGCGLLLHISRLRFLRNKWIRYLEL